MILTTLVSLLDGYLLLFIGYNQSILRKEWKWNEENIEILNIIYHLITAIGGLFSSFSTNLTNLKGLNWNVFIAAISLIISFFLVGSNNFYLYSFSLSCICFSNGHLFNIGTNLIIYKFSNERRAFVYSLVLFFNQLGKFIFATIIYKFNSILLLGYLKITIFPINLLLICILACNISIVYYMIKKFKEKMIIKSKKDEKSSTSSVRELSMSYYLESKKKKNQFIEKSSITVLSDKIEVQSLKNVILCQINELFTHKIYKDHTYKLCILNISLGVQFFSMINVFPHLSNSVSFFTNLVDEIFFSKLVHTILLVIMPFLFLSKYARRRNILFLTFSLNLTLNLIIIFGFLNATIIIHAFRFLWNISFITIEIYTAEAINKKYRNIFTSLMYFIFKVSCLVEIFTIDRMISISIYIPIFFNIILLLIDIIITKNLECEPHFLTLSEIENYFT